VRLSKTICLNFSVGSEKSLWLSLWVGHMGWAYIVCSKWPPPADTHTGRRLRHWFIDPSMIFWSNLAHSSMSWTPHRRVVIHITNSCLVDSLLKYSPYPIIHWIEVWTSRWPHVFFMVHAHLQCWELSPNPTRTWIKTTWWFLEMSSRGFAQYVGVGWSLDHANLGNVGWLVLLLMRKWRGAHL
jgi:hypothetical protein